MTSFKVVAVTPDDFERLVYRASERQVHLQDGCLKERVSFVSGCGLVLDPADYPAGTRFMFIIENAG